MRVTQRTMYNNFVGNMNRNLSDYMESNIQGASQKRINRPSDDPVGMARVLSYRASIEQNLRYENNSKDAAAWLSSTDSALSQAQVILTSMREAAEQIATGTVTAENRDQVASKLRQLFEQLVNVANTSYNNQHLFSGTKTDQSAYQIGLGITATGSVPTAQVNGQDVSIPWKVSGSANTTAMVRFRTSGEIGGTDDIDYEYSRDGGKTWVTKTLAAGDNVLDLDGTTITVPTADPDKGGLDANLTVEACDPDKDVLNEDGSIQSVSRDNGTVLFVRPAAYYQGDDNNAPPSVDLYGTSRVATADAYGRFTTDVRIRLDENADVARDGKVKYSYSMDNGVTWTTATADTHAGGDTLRIQVPGGYLDVEPQPGETLGEGQQFVIRPRRADLGMEIAQGEFISVTNSGKDIFGGLYAGPGQDVPVPVEGGASNIFEVAANLITWAETGIQEGCQEELANLKTASQHLLTRLAEVGGKEQRVSLNVSILEAHRDDQTKRMSSIEDVDLTELLTRFTQQQLAYQTVLKSSSMIMNLNLTNYI